MVKTAWQKLKRVDKRLLIAGGLFVVVGTFGVIWARADTPHAVVEAENGQVAGNSKVNSGGTRTYVQFGNSQPSATTYYVDCVNGDDARNGLSEATAWRSTSKANKATLAPGNKLLFKRGCTWSTLDAKWNGTNENPITIGAYGTGEAPHILLDGDGTEKVGVRLTGSYQIIENIKVSFTTPTSISNYGTCKQPIASLYGIRIMVGAHHNVVRQTEVFESMAGISLARGSHHNIVTDNHLHNNGIMQNDAGDLGAWGILVNGDNQEISWNDIHDNVAKCLHPVVGKYGSNSIELYEGDNNAIHHNYAHQDRVFSELGSTKTGQDIATGNVYAYNLFVSNMADSRFIVTRGIGADFGPVNNTYLTHNTVYLTGPGSFGVSCGQCTNSILRADSNIFWAEEKALTASGTFTNSNNIYYATDGTPNIAGISVDAAWKVNPQFVNQANGNFRLKTTSPARDTGVFNSLFALDRDRKSVPIGSGADVGAFEFGP